MAKKQGYNARLDDSLGSKNGKKKQSMKDRRDESEGMEKSKGNRKFSGNKSTDRKVKKVAKELGKKASPAKMYGKKKSPAKMKGGDKKKNPSAKTGVVSNSYLKKTTATKKPKTGMKKSKPKMTLKKTTSPMKMSGRSYDMKEAYNKDLSPSARLHYLENERHDKDSPNKMYGKKHSPNKMKGDPKKKKKSETYSNYKDFKGNMQKATIDDSTFTSDSTKFKAGINPKYKLNMNMSYDYNKKNNPKAVEFTERMSPLEKELVGKQHNLPAELKAKIEASPAKMYGKESPAKNYKNPQEYKVFNMGNEPTPVKMYGKKSPMEMSRELTYGGPVIDQEPKALSHMGASKVLRHMNGSKHSPLNMNGGPGKPKSKMAQGDTVRGFDNYKVGDMVSEDDFESKFKKKGNNPKNYPQLSVQDYSVVKKDARGKYVNRLKD